MKYVQISSSILKKKEILSPLPQFLMIQKIDIIFFQLIRKITMKPDKLKPELQISRGFSDQDLKPIKIKQDQTLPRNKITGKIQNQAHYLRRPAHLRPFNINKTLNNVKLNKMFSLVEQVVQSADQLSTFNDERKSLQQKLALQLYFSDRQNLQKFLERDYSKLCPEPQQKNGSMIENAIDTKNYTYKTSTVKQSQGLELTKFGSSFFNFHTFTYCGPYFKEGNNRTERYHSSNKVAEFHKLQNKLQAKEQLTVIEDIDRKRANSVSFVDPKPRFNANEIDFEIQRIRIQILQLQNTLEQLNKIKLVPIQSIVLPQTSEQDSKRTVRPTFNQQTVIRENWHVPIPEQKPINIRPQENLIDSTKGPQSHRQFSFGPVKPQQNTTTINNIKIVSYQPQGSVSGRKDSVQNALSPQDKNNTTNSFSNSKKIVIEYRSPDQSVNESRKTVQVFNPSIGQFTPGQAQQKDIKKTQNQSQGTVCDNLCRILPWSPADNPKNLRIIPTSTLHIDPYKKDQKDDFETSINYRPVVQTSNTKTVRNTEPDVRFYPLEGDKNKLIETQQENNQAKVEPSNVAVAKVTSENQQVPYQDVENRIRYSGEEEQKSREAQIVMQKTFEEKEVQTEAEQYKSVSLPATTTNFPTTSNNLPSSISEENNSLDSNNPSVHEQPASHDQLNLLIQQKQAEIQRLLDQLEKAKNQADSIKSQNEEKEAQIQRIKKQLQDKAEEIALIKAQPVSHDECNLKVTQKEEQVKGLIKQLEEAKNQIILIKSQPVSHDSCDLKVAEIRAQNQRLSKQNDGLKAELSLKVNELLKQEKSNQKSSNANDLHKLEKLIEDLKGQILKLRQRKSNLEQEKDLFKAKLEIYENKYGHLNDKEIEELRKKLKLKQMERMVRKQEEDKDLNQRLGISKQNSPASSNNPSRQNSPSKQSKLTIQINNRQQSPKKKENKSQEGEHDQLHGTQLNDFISSKDKRKERTPTKNDKLKRKSSAEQNSDEDDIRFEHRSSQVGSPKKTKGEKKQSQQSNNNQIPSQQQFPQHPFYPQFNPQQMTGNPFGYFNPMMGPNPYGGLVNNIYVNGSGASSNPPSTNTTDDRILKKIQAMEHQIIQNNNAIKNLQGKISQKGSKIKPQKSVSFVDEEQHQNQTQQIKKLKEELKELRKTKEKENNDLSQKIQELKRILKREREMLNQKHQELLELRSKSADKVQASNTLQVPGAQKPQKPHDHKKCEEAFKLYKDALLKKQEVNKKLKQRLKQLTDLINKDRETLKNLQRNYRVEVEKNKALKDQLREKDEELIRLKNEQIKRVHEDFKRGQEKTDVKYPTIEIAHRPDMSVVREEENQSSEEDPSKKSQKRSESDNQSLGISNKSKQSEPNIQVHSSSQRGATSQELLQIENNNMKQIQELKRRVHELQIEYREMNRDKNQDNNFNTINPNINRKQIEESKIQIFPHLQPDTNKKTPAFQTTRINFNNNGPEQSRIIFDDFSDEDAFDPAKLPEFIKNESEIKANVEGNSMFLEENDIYDPSYHDEKKNFEREMEDAKNRIFALSTKESDLKTLKDKIQELEKKEKILEDLENELRGMGHKVEDVPKILKDKDSVILTLKNQLPASTSSMGSGEEFNELKQRLVDKQNELLGLKRQLTVNLVICIEKQDQATQKKLKDEASNLSAQKYENVKKAILGINLISIQQVKVPDDKSDEKIKELQRQLESLKPENEKLKLKLGQVQTQNNEIKSKITGVEKEEFERQQKEKAALAEKIAEMERLNIQVGSTLSNAKAQNEREKGLLNQRIKELEEKLTQLHSAKDQAETKAKQLEGNDQLKSRVEKLAQQNEKAIQEKVDLKKQLSLLENQLELAACKLSEKQAQLMKEVKSKNNQIDRISKELNRLNIELDELQNLATKSKSLEESLKDLQMQNKKLDAAIKEKEGQNKKLQQSLEPLEHELENVKKQLQGEIKQLRRQLKAKEKELEQVKENQGQDEEQAQEQKQKIKALEQSKAALQKQLANLKRDNESLNIKTKQLQTSLKNASQQTQEFAITVNTLKDKVKSLQNSTGLKDTKTQEQQRKISELTNMKQKIAYDLSEISKKLKDRETELNKLKKQAQSNDKEAQKQRDQTENQRRQLSKKLKNAENLLYSANEQIEELTLDLARTKEKLGKEVPLRKETEKKNRELQNFIEEINDKISLLENQAKKLQLSKQKEAKEKKTLNDQLNQEKGVVSELQIKLKQAQDKNRDALLNVDKIKKQLLQLEKQLKEKESQLLKSQSDLLGKENDINKLTTSNASQQEALSLKLKAMSESMAQMADKNKELLREVAQLNEKFRGDQKMLEQKDKLVKEKQDELIQLHKRILDFEGKLQDLLEAREKEQLEKKDFSKKLRLKETQLLNSKKDSMTREEQVLKQLQSQQSLMRSLEKQIKEQEIAIKQLNKRINEQDQLYQQLDGLHQKECDEKSKLLAQLKSTQNQLIDKSREVESLSLELQGLRKKLNMDREVYEGKIKELKREIEALNAMRKTKEQDYERRIKLLQDSISQKETDLRNKQGELASLAEQLNRLSESSQNSTSNLNGQIKELNRKLKEKETELAQLHKELESSLKDHQKHKNLSQNQRKSLKDKIQKLQNQLKSLKQTKSSLESKINEKEKLITELQKRIVELDKKLIDKINETTRLVSTIESFRLKERDLEAEKLQQGKRLQTFAKKYAQTKLELETLYTEFSLKEDEHNQLMKDSLRNTSQLSKNLGLKQIQIDSLAQEIADLEQELLALKDKTKRQEELNKKEEIRKKQELERLRATYDQEIQKLKADKTLKQEQARKMRKRIQSLQDELRKITSELNDEGVKEEQLKKLRSEENKQKKDVEKTLRVKEEDLRRLREQLQGKEQQMKIFKDQEIKQRQALLAQIQEKQAAIKQLQALLNQKEADLITLKENEQKLKQMHTLNLLAKEEELFKVREQLKIMELEMSHLDKLGQIEKGEKEKLVKKIKELQAELTKAKKDASLKEGKLSDELDKRERAIRELTNSITLGQLDRANLNEIINKLNLTIEDLRGSLAQKESELKTHFTEIHQLNLRIEDLSSSVDLIAAENQNLKDLLNHEKKSREKLLKDRDVEINKLTVVVNKKDTEFVNGNKKLYDDLEKAVKETLSLRNQLNTKVLEFTSKLDLAEKQKERLGKIIKEKDQLLAYSNTQANRLKTDLDKLIKERSFGEESHKRALNEFKKQIESLKNVIDDKESEINSLLNEISKLNGKIKSLEDLCANTQTLQESTHNDSLTLETNLLKLSQENDKFKSLNKQLQDQLNKLRKQAQLENKRLQTQFDRQISEKDKEIERLFKMLEDLRQKNILKEDALTKLTQQNNELSRREKDHLKVKAKEEKELKSLESKIKLFESQIDKLVNMINEFHIKETDMINKLNDRDQQILTLTHQLKQKDTQLANNNQDLAFKIEQLSQMIEKQAIENRQNARLMKELEANNKDILAQNIDLTEQMKETKSIRQTEKNERKELLKNISKLQDELYAQSDLIDKLQTELKLAHDNGVSLKAQLATRTKQHDAETAKIRKELTKNENDLYRNLQTLKNSEANLTLQLNNKIIEIQTLSKELAQNDQRSKQIIQSKSEQLESLNQKVKDLTAKNISLKRELDLKDEEQFKQRQKLLADRNNFERRLKDRQIELNSLNLTLKDLEEKNKLFNSIREKELAERRDLAQLILLKEQEQQKMKDEFNKNSAQLAKGQNEEKLAKTDFAKKMKEKQGELMNLKKSMERKDLDIQKIKEKEEAERQKILNRIAEKDTIIESLNQKIQDLEQKDRENQRAKEKLTQQINNGYAELQVITKQLQKSNIKIKEYELKIPSTTAEIRKKDSQIKEGLMREKAKELQLLAKDKQLNELYQKLNTASIAKAQLQKSLYDHQSLISEYEAEIAALKKEIQLKNNRVTQLTLALQSQTQLKEVTAEKLKAKEKELSQTKQQFYEIQSKLEESQNQLSQLNKQLAIKSRSLEKQLQVNLQQQEAHLNESNAFTLKIQELSSTILMLKGEVAQLNGTLGQERKNHEKQLKDKQIEANKLNNLINKKEMEITGLNKKLFEESSKAVKEVENTKNTLDSHIVNVNLRLQNVEKEKGALAKQIQEKMQLIVQLQNSLAQQKSSNNELNKLKSIQQDQHKKLIQQLNDTIESKNKTIDSKNTDLQLQSVEINKLNSKIKSLEGISTALKSQQETIHVTAVTSQTQILKLTQDNEKLRSLNKQLQDQLNKLKKESELQNKRLNNLIDKESNERKRDQQKLNRTIDDLKLKISTKEQSLAKLNEDINEFVRREKQSAKLKAKEEKQLKALESKLKQFEAQTENLLTLIKNYQLNEAQLQKKLAEKQAAVQNLDSKLKTTESQLLQKNQDLLIRLQQLSQMIEKQALELRQAAKSIKELQLNNKDLVTQNAELNQEIEELKNIRASEKAEKKELLKTISKYEDDLAAKDEILQKVDKETKLEKEKLASVRNQLQSNAKEIQNENAKLKRDLAKKDSDLTREKQLKKDSDAAHAQLIATKNAEIQSLVKDLAAVKKQRDILFQSKDKELQALKIQIKEFEEEVDSLEKQISLKDEQQFKEKQRLLTERNNFERRLKDKQIELNSLNLTLKDLEEKNKLFNSIREKQLAERRDLAQLTLQKEQELQKMKDQFIKNQAQLIKGQDQQKNAKNEFSRKLKEKQIQVANLRRALQRKDFDMTKLREKEQNDRKQSASKMSQKDSDILALRQKIQILEQRQKQTQKIREKQAQQLKTTVYQLTLAREEHEKLRARIKDLENRISVLTNELKQYETSNKENEIKTKAKQIQFSNKDKQVNDLIEKSKSLEERVTQLQQTINEYDQSFSDLEGQVVALRKQIDNKNKTIEELKKISENEKNVRQQLSTKLKNKDKQLQQAKQNAIQTKSSLQSTSAQISQLNKQLNLKSHALEKQQQSYKQLQESLGKDKDSYGKMIDELNYKITAYSRENNTLRQETNRNLEGLNKEKRQLETEKMLLLNKLKEKDMLIEKMRSDSNSKSEQYTARIQKLEEDLRMLRGKISEGEQRQKELLKSIDDKAIDAKIYELRIRLAGIDMSEVQEINSATNSPAKKSLQSSRKANESPSKNAQDSPFMKLFELEQKVKELEKFKQIRNPDDVKKQQDEYQAKKTQLDNQVKKLKAQIASKQRANENQARDIQRKQAELAKLRENLRNFQKQLSDAKTNWDRSQKEKQQLQASIEKQEKRIAFLESKEKEFNEQKALNLKKQKEIDNLKLRLDSLLVELQAIERERANLTTANLTINQQKDAELSRKQQEILKLKNAIDLKEKELQRKVQEVQTYKSKEKDLTTLLKMIERHKNELLNLYRQLLAKQLELQNYVISRNRNSTYETAEQTDENLKLQRQIQQKSKSISNLTSSKQDKQSLTRFNRMVDFHKKEVIHLHTQLRNKYEYFRKANPQIVSRDNDPETLRMELEATKNSLLTQQKIFGKILGSGSVEEKNTVNLLSVSSTLPIRGSTQSISNSQISSISLSNSSVTESGLRKAQSGQKELTASMFVQKTEDVLNLKKQLNDRDQEISELKRLIREHLTISSQHINPDAEQSEDLVSSVESGVNAAFVELVQKGAKTEEVSQMKKSIKNFDLNAIVEVEEQNVDDKLNISNKPQKAKEEGSQRENYLMNGEKRKTSRPPILSLESLVPQFFENRPNRPKSVDQAEVKTTVLNDSKKYKPSKSGLFTVQSITPQYFGSK